MSGVEFRQADFARVVFGPTIFPTGRRPITGGGDAVPHRKGDVDGTLRIPARKLYLDDRMLPSTRLRRRSLRLNQ